MRSLPAFLGIAAAVTLTPGPSFALLLQVAIRHGRRAALANIAGNSLGVLVWGALAALGVSALVTANQVAFDVLRAAGAVFLIWLGVRALIGDPRALEPATGTAGFSRSRSPAASSIAWRSARRGLINSLANPKLAVFFVALFPQFLAPGASVLPAALAMAAMIVAFDLLWYGTVAVVVDRCRVTLRPRVTRRLEQLSGAVLVAFGLRLAAEAGR